MKLRGKFVLTFLSIAFFVGLMGMLGMQANSKVNTEFDHLSTITSPMIIALGQMQAGLYKMHGEALSITILHKNVSPEHEESLFSRRLDGYFSWINPLQEYLCSC